MESLRIEGWQHEKDCCIPIKSYWWKKYLPNKEVRLEHTLVTTYYQVILYVDGREFAKGKVISSGTITQNYIINFLKSHGLKI